VEATLVPPYVKRLRPRETVNFGFILETVEANAGNNSSIEVRGCVGVG
jgi:hypothetical protein